MTVEEDYGIGDRVMMTGDDNDRGMIMTAI